MSPVWWMLGAGVVLLIGLILYELSGYEVHVLLVKGKADFMLLDYDPENPEPQKEEAEGGTDK